MSLIALALRHWRSLVVGAVLLAGLVWHRLEVSSAYRRGGEAARIEIERANRDAERKADEAERGLEACPLGQWNRETGTCNPR